MQYVAGGAALGAVLGAVAGLLYLRQRQSSGEVAEASGLVPVDRGKLMRLGIAVLALVRQITEL